MKKDIKYLIILSFIGCAHNENETTSKIYSDDTNRAFEMIERSGPYYLKNPPAYNPPPKIEVHEKIVEDKKRGNQKNLQPKRIKKKAATEILNPVLKNTLSTSKSDERLIEINQNLAFYCMKHRKDRAYGGDEAKCMKHVEIVMNNCQKLHQIVNSKLLNCIQKKFKNK